MEADFQVIDRYLMVKMPEEIDHHQSFAISRKADSFLMRDQIRGIVFDFEDTKFMDSSGVGMLISRYRDLSMCGGTVCAAGVCPAVEKLFYVSGLHKIIRVYSEVEDVFNGQK